MGLYYSGNAMDWWPAGVLDYHLDFAAHFTYPHMALAGDDLLVVTSKWCGSCLHIRAAFSDPGAA